MKKTLLYLITLILVVALVVYLNLKASMAPDETRLSNEITPALYNGAKITPINSQIVPSIDTKTVSATPTLPVINQSNTTTLISDSGEEKDVLERMMAEQAADASNTVVINTRKISVRALLMPSLETTIGSTISGRIISLKGGLGQSFKKGSVLVSFACDQSRARVEIAKAELAGALEQHEAKVKMQGLDQASDVEVSLAASASNKAKAELRLNRTLVSECRIYAPWSGRVAKSHVHKNMTVNAGEPLLDIVNTGRLKLKLNIPSELLRNVKIGTKFDVMIDETGNNYNARISAINSRIDPVSQTVEVEAKMDKAYAELLAGMSGIAYLTQLESTQ